MRGRPLLAALSQQVPVYPCLLNQGEQHLEEDANLRLGRVFVLSLVIMGATALGRWRNPRRP